MYAHVCSMALNSKLWSYSIIIFGKEKTTLTRIRVLKAPSHDDVWCSGLISHVLNFMLDAGEKAKSQIYITVTLPTKKTFPHPFLPPVLYEKTRYFTRITYTSFF
jgi:hypothetical protein